jgi:hypothetical protein
MCDEAGADLSLVTDAAMQRAAALMDDPKVWAAVLAVAALVDGQAETSGAEITSVALAALDSGETA